MASANIANTYVVPVETTVSPYYDDFDEAKNFNRILFRPGYAVQARELTQLQTIHQNQIERFGRSIYDNGSPVIGGDVFIPDDTFIALNLSSTYANTEITASQFQDTTIIFGGGSSNVVFRVIQTSEATQDEPPTLYGKYITDPGTGNFPDGSTIKIDDQSVFANLASANSSTTAKIAFIRDSVFFYSGYFVKVPKQALVIGKNNTRPTCRIGLEMNDAIVTEAEDSSLLDPAQEATNFQAPGAARYQVNLNLAYRTMDSTDDSKFIELVRLTNGVVVSQVKGDQYSVLGDELAKRTYDQSGNFTVTPFSISMDMDAYDPLNYVAVSLSPGKAYIYGYEYATMADTVLRVPTSKATNNVSNYLLNMNYGNYVIVDKVNGVFNTSTSALVDIHCVPQANVNSTNNATYLQTKIGTARVKDLEFYGGDIDVTARRYEFYLFDTNFVTINSNVATVGANSITLFNDTTKLTNVTDAYVGGTVVFSSGTASGYKYKVTAYNGSTKTLYLDSIFFETPDTTSNVALQFDFSVSESFVSSPLYTSGATGYANANITALNKANNEASGLTYISEPSLNTLLFPLPDSYIANGISGMTYSYHKLYNSISFTNGVSAPILSATDEGFLGASSSSNTSLTVMDNFLVICTNPGSSGRSNNEMVKVTTNITPGSPSQVILTSGSTGDTFTASVYAKMEYFPGVLPKTKTWIQSNTSTLSTETGSTFVGSTGSTATVYLNAAQTVITNPSRAPGVSESLYVSDVIGIDKIYDLNGSSLPTQGDPINGLTDVTDRYELDNGQRLSLYDHASIKLRPNYAPCVGPLIVCYYYYSHSIVAGGGGYFSVDSYPNLNNPVTNNGNYMGYGYAIIPQFIQSNGDIVELRDSIDFRPARENATNTYPGYTLTGLETPVPTSDFLMDYSYYLGRRDLIVLTSSRQITTVTGQASINPQDPAVPSKSMVLYSIGIPPYTKTPNDITARYVDNKRYTMRDIGKIEKRVENLEYYVSLNQLETSTVSKSITDVNGLNRTKYGIFTDSFVGHALGNSNLDDYACAMNFSEGYLQCQSTTVGVPLSISLNQSSGVTVYKDKVLLNNTERVYTQQPYATKDEPVAEFLYAVFEGNILTLPDADIWKDTNTSPTIVVSDMNTIETTTINVYQSIVNSQSRTA